MREAGVTLRAVYATLAPDAVAAAVAAAWELGAAPRCTLLNRGLNDVYALATPRGRFVARVSGSLRPAGSEVAAETAFLAWLDAAGVPVAAALPTRAGALSVTVAAPEGPRALVVFREAPGRAPGLDDPADAFAQGVTLARLHDAADRYPARAAGHRLDLEHLLHRPLAAILTLDALSAAARHRLQGLASRLADGVAAADGAGSAGGGAREGIGPGGIGAGGIGPGGIGAGGMPAGRLSRTRLHGDCHGLNARIADGVATFFDFDDGGFGHVAYDLAVHLWAQLSFGRSRHRMWHGFVAGYRSVRAIPPADFDAIRLYVPIRHLWLIGGFAVRAAEWGSETLSTAWLDRETEFLGSWERERLGRELF